MSSQQGIGGTLAARVAIITHRHPELTRDALVKVLELCRDEHVEAVVPERELEKYSLDATGLAEIVHDLIDEKVDFCIAIGGDGTILRAFNHFRGMQTPVLGINFGQVGFLSAIDPHEIGSRLAPFFRGDYELHELSLLEMHYQHGKQLAVNDVVLNKPEGGSAIKLGYQVGDVEMDSFNCDGMVAATPAGSTAYNLSTGGPLISPGLDALVLTAIAPHTLRSRAMVLCPGENAVIGNLSAGAAVDIFLDGRHVGDLAPGASIRVSLASEKARLLQAPGASFYRTLRDKFILK